MFGLLYSLRTRKFVVPFTFDVTNRGFERGVWTDTSIVIVKPFTFDQLELGFDQGIWMSDEEMTQLQPFTLDNPPLGFDIGYWSDTNSNN